jgi:hypothetical protein
LLQIGTVPIAFSAVAPSVVQMSVGATLSGVTLIGPRGIRTFHIPSFTVAATDHELALGDTAFAPLVLRWKEGNFNWNFAPCSALPPPGSTARTLLAIPAYIIGRSCRGSQPPISTQDWLASERRRRLWRTDIFVLVKPFSFGRQQSI